MARVSRCGPCALVAGIALAVPAVTGASFPGDNGLIAFQNDSFGGIYTIHQDGSDRTKLGDGFEPSWSPSGKRIAFVKETGGGDTEVFTMKRNGSDKTRVTDTGAYEWEPAFSPDGKSLVYRVGEFRSALGKLYTVPVGGGHRTRLGTGKTPDWSVTMPGANKGLIAYADADAPDPCFGGIEIFTRKPTGGGPTLLPFGCQTALDPSWRPDGEQLAFAAYPPVGNSDIYIGPPDGDGAGKTRLTDLANQDDGPAWSPDGTQVAFDDTDNGLWTVSVSAPLAEVSIPNTTNVDGALPAWQPK